MNADFTIKPLVGKPLDYSSSSNWMFFDKEQKQKVDVFYLYPTSVSPQCKELVSDVDDYMKHQSMLNYLRSAAALASCGNMFAPYYRQISGVGILKAGTADALEDMCRNNITRTDVFAALDYFFAVVNHDRPFILAGHSQGTVNLKIALSEYMRLHPAYMERMVACYSIGYYFPEAWFKANPHVKKATGETDTGVMINWNTEKPGCKMFNLPVGDGYSYVINPLNWKIDETPAPLEANLGSVEVDEEKLIQHFVPGKADATIDLKRGVLICTTSDDYLPENEVFGEGSFHIDDWALYYNNITENAKKRIAAFLKANF